MAEPQDWFKANAPQAAPPPSGTWEDRGIAGKVWHPAEAPAAERVDSDVVGGIPLIGGISPEMVLGTAVPVGRAIGGAVVGAGGKAVAGAKALAEQLSPQIKYEVTKSTLIAMGVPAPMAMASALAISGLKGRAKPEPVPEGPHLDLSVPMRPGQMTQQQIKERMVSGTGTPPPKAGPKPKVGVTAAEPVAADLVAQTPPTAPAAQSAAPPPRVEPAPSLPNQKALNEEALARRRAEYQARQAAPPKPALVKLNAAETSAYLNLMLQGKSSSEAMASVLQQRELIALLGTPSPTAQQKRFPKGMRGKS